MHPARITGNCKYADGSGPNFISPRQLLTAFESLAHTRIFRTLVWTIGTEEHGGSGGTLQYGPQSNFLWLSLMAYSFGVNQIDRNP